MESVGSPVGSAALDSCLLYACRVHSDGGTTGLFGKEELKKNFHPLFAIYATYNC